MNTPPALHDWPQKINNKLLKQESALEQLSVIKLFAQAINCPFMIPVLSQVQMEIHSSVHTQVHPS